MIRKKKKRIRGVKIDSYETDEPYMVEQDDE